MKNQTPTLKTITREDYETWASMVGSRGIGGSYVAALLDRSKWESPFSVWKNMLFGREDFTNEYMERGIRLEPILVQQFLDKNPQFEMYHRDDNLLHVHPEYPYMVAAVDGIVRHKETKELYILEIKTTTSFNLEEWRQGIPEYYFTQVLHYVNCTNIPRAIIYISFRDGDNEKESVTHLITEESLPDFKNTRMYILDKVIKFWEQYIIPRKAPVIDGSDATTKAMQYLHENEINIADSVIGLKENIDSIVEAREHYAELLKEVTEVKKSLDNIIKGFVGSGSKEIGSYSVVYKTYSRNSFNAKQFKEENEDLYNSYVTPSSYQRLTITKKKD